MFKTNWKLITFVMAGLVLLASIALAVPSIQLIPAAIAAALAEPNTVNSAAIIDGEVKRADIANGAVGTTKLGANAVRTSNVGNDAITNSKIINNAVTTSKILDGEVGAADIGDDAVGAGELQGVTKLIFAECTYSFISEVNPGSVQTESCSVTGVDSDDNVVATLKDSVDCFVLEKVSTSTDMVNVHLINVCSAAAIPGTFPVSIIAYDS
jgi:hypothetical protein